MVFTKKLIITCNIIMLSYTCYAMESIKTSSNLAKFGESIVAYEATMMFPQGFVISTEKEGISSVNQYAYIEEIKQLPSNEYVMRVLLPKTEKNKYQGFVLNPMKLNKISLRLRSIDDIDKKRIIYNFLQERVRFSKGLDKNSKKSKDISASLV